MYSVFCIWTEQKSIFYNADDINKPTVRPDMHVVSVILAILES